ncbi:class II fructose-bisphosphate aldolase [Flagellimonas meridianipacifica]|uniref:Fructose-bisphosphate aldolase class II/tagatose 1,6-diphosphate aldolase GatY/KbaY n=1 Tax=Flagellimonas meridianipacifica TaxID=1080225 RepID=A0A2T0M8N6_9FLAO|nr:class II fructose-bisphosphate aldolase [Allomuricauda pacifica]PRX53833.1 fructose-bisphosphate aldolase class II/tagatose 1,6-diphosphate aldolase GatY/KbaY [Allomuricauda pacifica]
MALVSIKPMLKIAQRDKYAVAAFNPVDYASMKAMIIAAQECDAPVIIQTSAKTIRYYGHETLFSWFEPLAKMVNVPVALHLDHGKDLDMIKRCIDIGWTSVMIDASDKPFEENLRITKEVVSWADTKGVGVEAEIGEIGGVEEDIVVAEEDAHLANPDEAERFCKEIDLGVFAAAIGTAHGYYHGEPDVQFDLIEEINQRTGTPMALHGGTGLDEETIARCIALGCAKVNISTNLKHVFIDSFVDHKKENPNDYEPLSYLKKQFESLKTLFKDKITEFGGQGKGAQMLKEIN